MCRLPFATSGKNLSAFCVQIAFHHKWKDSLSELSGGQRSLLALSLILALLKVKPAPVYILDEVDAALDLSHTQNIGTFSITHWAAARNSVQRSRQLDCINMLASARIPISRYSNGRTSAVGCYVLPVSVIR